MIQLLQVELKEYVKVEDTIYEVNHQSLVPEDRLSFSRVTTFKVNETSSDEMNEWWNEWNSTYKKVKSITIHDLGEYGIRSNTQLYITV